MNSLTLIGFLFLSILLCTGAAAPQKKSAFKDPDGFAGLKWFAPVSEAESRFQVRSVKSKSDRETDAQCWIKIGDMLLNSTLTFLDGGFVSAFLLAEPNDKDNLVEAFRQRYGKPSAETAGGLLWTGELVTIVLMTSPTRIGGSPYLVAQVTHKKLTDYKEVLRKQEGKRAAKDL